VDAIRLTVLWPDPGRVPREPPDDGTGINNVSIVLLGEIGARRFLLTGDIEDGVDPELLARGMPPIDVLKVAHHGSRTATTAAFVDAVRPKIAVASAGADNTYGHPARSTLTRLADAGARVYRTDVDGSVTIGFEASAITVSRRPRSSADAPAARTLAGLSGEPGGRARPQRSAARAFVCAIPALVDVAPVGDVGLAGPPPRNRFGAIAAASPTPHAAGRGRGWPLGYHRSDDHPVTGESGCPAALAGSPVAGGRTRVRSRRGRVRPRRGTAPMIAPLLYVWGDDDLGSERLVARFATALEAELGSPLERWDVRADLATAGPVSAQLAERLATGVLFGGGTLAVVANPGALVRRNETRDRVVGALGQMAAGNAVAFVEASASNAKGPGPRRLADAVTAAGGRIVATMAPRPTALGAWIESEARERGLPLAPGAAREIADRLGARVTDGDVDRRFLSRVASTELDKLALRHTSPATPVTVDDVRALVAESTPGSVWALTDAVGERRADGAAVALDRLLDATPEPVLLAVLHRRTAELLELGDRLATGMALPAAARAMGISSEYRARMLAAQAQRWDTTELIAALGGLVELDAMVKGVPGSASDAAQRRLAFQLWVRDHVEREGPADGTTTRRGR
jgi:DNA polymerase III delta subunit